MRNATRNGILTRILAKSIAAPVRRVTAFAFKEKTPPAEIQLWNLGDNPTDYGVHRWTDRSAAVIGARYQARGNPLLIDVEHNGAKVVDAEGTPVDADEPPVTGGYARLELRAGAPWLVFDWSAYAVEQISTGQRRFLSPEYDVDRDTGEIVGLLRVSLVADPGTHHARMLASAATRQETQGMDPIVIAALRAALTAEDPKVAIEALLGELEKAGDGGGDAGGMPEAAAAPPGDAPPAPAGDKKDPPIAAAAEDKEKATAAPVTATAAAPPAAPAAPKPVRAAAPAPAEVVDLAARRDVENMRRDVLLEKEGARLAEPIRVWASSQPYDVVKGLIDAAPAVLAPPARVQATRGSTTAATREPGASLSGEAKTEFQKLTGTTPRTKFGPSIEADGSLRIHACTPTEYRAAKGQVSK